MPKTPLCLVLLALVILPAPAHAFSAAERIAAPAAEPVRFERGSGPTHRADRHRRRGPGQKCRRCGRRGGVVAFVDRDEPKRARPDHPIALPENAAAPTNATITATTDTLGPLRLRLYSSTWVERCEEKHPTFVARTGTYEGENGVRQRCE